MNRELAHDRGCIHSLLNSQHLTHGPGIQRPNSMAIGDAATATYRRLLSAFVQEPVRWLSADSAGLPSLRPILYATYFATEWSTAAGICQGLSLAKYRKFGANILPPCAFRTPESGEHLLMH